MMLPSKQRKCERHEWARVCSWFSAEDDSHVIVDGCKICGARQRTVIPRKMGGESDAVRMRGVRDNLAL